MGIRQDAPVSHDVRIPLHQILVDRQHVARLDVAVQNAAAVRVVDRHEDGAQGAAGVLAEHPAPRSTRQEGSSQDKGIVVAVLAGFAGPAMRQRLTETRCGYLVEGRTERGGGSSVRPALRDPLTGDRIGQSRGEFGVRAQRIAEMTLRGNVAGQRPGLVGCPRPDRVDELRLVDQAVLEGAKPEEEIRLHG